MTTYTVAEVARVVGQAINRALPEEIWVQGEIRDLSRPNSGHVYFTLVDPDFEQGQGAMLPVTLFSSDKVAVNRVLQRSGAVRMTDGVHVRIRGQVSHYAARGTVQLRMTWIDTDYTLGKLAAERDRLIRSLDQRGLLSKNRALEVPLVPLDVGLITSRGSAAEADFIDELAGSGYAWKIRVVDARVQGVDAIGDVVRAIKTLARASVDTIAIVRGGGAQTDLAAFDSEQIALAIADCPLPVLTGIGHEIDVSVADLMARSHKTPTACAGALVSTVASFTDRIDHIAFDTRRVAQSRLASARHGLTVAGSRLMRSSDSAGERAHERLTRIQAQLAREGRRLLHRHERNIAGVAERLARTGQFHLDAAATNVDRMAAMASAGAMRSIEGVRGHLDGLEHRLGLLDPERLLARGWSITRTAAGSLVTSPAAVSPGETLRTTVSGGEITSVVTEEADDG